MRKAASMFIFLVLGTACIIDLEPAETDVVQSSVGAGDPGAGLDVMAARGELSRPDEAAPGAGTGLGRACPGCGL